MATGQFANCSSVVTAGHGWGKTRVSNRATSAMLDKTVFIVLRSFIPYLLVVSVPPFVKPSVRSKKKNRFKRLRDI